MLLYNSLLSLFLFYGQSSIDLDNILDKHYEAVNQSARSKLSTLSVSGSYNYYSNEDSYKSNMPTMGGEYMLQVEKNNSYYEKIDIYEAEELIKTHEYLVYDGKAWNRDAFGVNAWQFGEADSINIKYNIDLEGALYHWQQKGHRLKYLGKKEVENKSFYCIEFTTKDGYVEYDYLDTKTYLLAYRSLYREFDGSYSTSLYRYSNYKNIRDIPFAHKVTHKVFMMNKTVVSENQFDKILVNGTVIQSISD